MSINVIVREGNLTKDVTYFAGSGEKKSFASLRVASYGGKNGEEKLTIYASVKCYGFLADQIKDCQKGDTVVFSGRVVSDPYEKDGETVQSESIVASDITYRKKGENAPVAEAATKTKKATKTKAAEPDDDVVPF
jgi:single-stranded DNA-binding protein